MIDDHSTLKSAGVNRNVLHCDHCGDVAIWSDTSGLFFEDCADACDSCGIAGSISIYEDDEASWHSFENEKCDNFNCEECNE